MILYVCFASLQSRGVGTARLLCVALTPLLLFELWRRTSDYDPKKQRQAQLHSRAIRALAWGSLLWLAARTGPPGRAAFDAAANLGVGVACVAALICLARIPSSTGIMKAHPRTQSLDAAFFVSFLWGVAVALPATRALFGSQRLLMDPLAVDYATTAAALGTLLVLIATSWRLRAQRRLELGIGDRAAAALALTTSFLLIAIPGVMAKVAPPDRLLPLAALCASTACMWCALTPEPTRVSSALRGSLALMILGTPVVLTTGVLARNMPDRAGPIALAGGVLAILVGLAGRAAAKPLGPEQSRWLDAFQRASNCALEPEPEAAIRAALEALGRATTTPDNRPQLWRNDPPEVMSVDVAGYLHTERAAAPASLYELAMAEPERTLRVDALAAQQVRRPDVRPLLDWFETRDAFSATLVLDADGISGFILLPRGLRKSAMTLEEARAIRSLADRLSALLSVSSALAGARDRVLQATGLAEELGADRDRLARIVDSGADRNRAVAEHLASPVRRSAYSAAASLVVAELERCGRLNAPTALLTPPGVDATGWAAICHLASPRADGPFVVAQGASSRTRALSYWEDDSTSPIVLADGGSLLVLDAAALPQEVQSFVTRTIARLDAERSDSTVPAARVLISLRRPTSMLVNDGQLDPGLASQMLENESSLPQLSDRPEDMRALILDAIAQTGARHRGEPIGIEAEALKLLMDHPWPGNDLELSSVVSRTVALNDGPLLQAQQLTPIGLHPISITPPIVTPLPDAPLRRRRRARRPPRR